MSTQTQQIPIGGKLTSTQPQQLSIRELSALYDRIYDIADRLIKKHNPCKIHTKNKKLYCICFPTGRKRLCCYGCWNMEIDHYSLFGCTTKCLLCKTYLCKAANRENILLAHRLTKLKKFMHKYIPALYCYTSKEQWLKQIEG